MAYETEWKPTDYHLYDRQLAVQRIYDQEKNLYGIETVGDLHLKPTNFQTAQELCDNESAIVHEGTHVLTNEGLKNGLIYCLLSPRQDYAGHIKAFNELTVGSKPVEEMSLGRICHILKSSGVSLSNQKSGYIFDLLKRLGNRDYPTIIGDNIGHGRDVEVTLRDILIKDFKGIGPKTASMLLRMCGARSVIPVDSWMAELLYFHGYPIQTERVICNAKKWRTDDIVKKSKKVGLTGKIYELAEKYTFDLAQEYNIPAAVLQAAYYAKFSSYISN